MSTEISHYPFSVEYFHLPTKYIDAYRDQVLNTKIIDLEDLSDTAASSKLEITEISKTSVISPTTSPVTPKSQTLKTLPNTSAQTSSKRENTMLIETSDTSFDFDDVSTVKEIIIEESDKLNRFDINEIKKSVKINKDEILKSIHSKKYDELRSICSALKLPRTGKKVEMIEKIQKYFKQI